MRANGNFNDSIGNDIFDKCEDVDDILLAVVLESGKYATHSYMTSRIEKRCHILSGDCKSPR